MPNAWSGDDWREFDHPDRCPHCGASPDEGCDDLCDCERCQTEANQALLEALAAAEES